LRKSLAGRWGCEPLTTDWDRQRAEARGVTKAKSERGVGTRDEFETDIAQAPRKTGHHPRPEDKASQQDRQLYEICKTSIPGSNPGGASNSPVQISIVGALAALADAFQLDYGGPQISGLSPRPLP
jgi:hypothetical protein